MKDFSRLVPDIYKLMCDREVDPSTTLEAEAEHFAQECKDIFLSMMAPDKDRSGKLRMSRQPPRHYAEGYGKGRAEMRELNRHKKRKGQAHPLDTWRWREPAESRL